MSRLLFVFYVIQNIVFAENSHGYIEVSDKKFIESINKTCLRYIDENIDWLPDNWDSKRDACVLIKSPLINDYSDINIREGDINISTTKKEGKQNGDGILRNYKKTILNTYFLNKKVDSMLISITVYYPSKYQVYSRSFFLNDKLELWTVDYLEDETTHRLILWRKHKINKKNGRIHLESLYQCDYNNFIENCSKKNPYLYMNINMDSLSFIESVLD